MSLVIEQAVKSAVDKAVYEFLFSTPENGYNDLRATCVIKKRRAQKMSWMDFSDKELRIVNEVEKTPGMGGKQIVALMSTFDSEYPDGQCEESTTKVLLSNLVGRKVLISQGKNGYILNDSDTPPPCKLPILPPA